MGLRRRTHIASASLLTASGLVVGSSMLLGAAPAPVNDPVADQAAHLAPRFPAPPAASAPLEPFDLSWQGGEGEVSTEPRFSGRLPEPEMAPAERGLVAKSQPPADSNEVSRAAESDRDVEPAGDPETDRDAEPDAYVGSDGERIDASRLRVWLQGRDSQRSWSLRGSSMRSIPAWSSGSLSSSRRPASGCRPTPTTPGDGAEADLPA